MKIGFVLMLAGVQTDVEKFMTAVEKAARERFGASVVHRDGYWYDPVVETLEAQITAVVEMPERWHPAQMTKVMAGMLERAWEIGTAYGGTAMGDGGLNVWTGRFVWDHKRYD